MKVAPTPEIAKLSRREFLVLGGAAAAMLSLGPQDAGASPASRTEGVALSRLPSTSPGFQARSLQDGGLLVWTRSPDGELTAYRLNQPGRQVWELCSGERQRSAIGEQYRRLTGRSESEGIAFLDRLLSVGVVVSGGSVVAAGAFPVPTPGGAYHSRIDSDQAVD